MKGEPRRERPRVDLTYAFWSFVSGTAGVLTILVITRLSGYPLLIGSFGASAVLLFGATESPLAQPRNLVGGHLVSALVAVVLVGTIGSGILSVALAVGFATLLMYLTDTVHPPGGATAIIGVQGHAGIGFLAVPVLAGTIILLLIALFTNNVVYHRTYPRHWR